MRKVWAQSIQWETSRFSRSRRFELLASLIFGPRQKPNIMAGCRWLSQILAPNHCEAYVNISCWWPDLPNLCTLVQNEIVHKLFPCFSKFDRAGFAPKIMIFNKKNIFKAFQKCQENCHILHSNWVSELTDSTKINRQGHNIRMYWTNFRQPTVHV